MNPELTPEQQVLYKRIVHRSNQPVPPPLKSPPEKHKLLKRRHPYMLEAVAMCKMIDTPLANALAKTLGELDGLMDNGRASDFFEYHMQIYTLMNKFGPKDGPFDHDDWYSVFLRKHHSDLIL